MIVRKKLPYYVLAVIVIEFMCMLTNCMIMDDGIYSFLKTVLLYTKEQMTEQNVTAAGVMGRVDSYWMYIIMAVVVCIPTISYMFDEMNSNIYLGVQMRKGRYQYILSKCIFSMISGAVIVLISLSVFLIILMFMLPVNCDSDMLIADSVITIGTGELINVFLHKTVKFSLYAGAVSLFGIFTVLVYVDLLFDLSLVFILAYFSADAFMYDILWAPIAAAAVLMILCSVIWGYRSRRL